MVAPWFPSSVNPGAGSFIARDVMALQKEHEVRVVHLIEPKYDAGDHRTTCGKADVFRVPMLKNKPLQVLNAAKEIRKLSRGADVIHSMAVTSLIPIRFMASLSAPLVHTEHYTGVTRARSPKLAAGYFSVYQRPKVISSVSTFLADAVTRLSKRESRVIPNIVDSDGYIEPRKPDGKLRLLSIGGLVPKKDPLMAVRTLAELRSRGYEAELSWAGMGPMEDELVKLAQELGIRNQLKLLGQINHKQVIEQIADSDLILHTSTVETFSLVAAETLISGRPLVIQSVGGHRDFAVGPYAQFPAERSPEAFADAVEKAFSAREGQDWVGNSKELQSRFSEESFLQSWNRIYREVSGN